MDNRVTVEQGEFKGWSKWDDQPFEHDLVGPFYFRTDEQGPVAAFRAENRHTNAAGTVHGGCLMTFADFALFVAARESFDDDSYGVTVSFSSEFLRGPQPGQLIEGRAEVLKSGRQLVFLRGIITADGKPCLNFSGSLMRLQIKS
ncbi:PaaI family thioesterase [Ruegeria halocynthiae]|uniref:PaaI family thioesterase n=1 Tax=Ruegeria halocynthiae TaxID=985054 RepID=UPI000562DC9E|nr:PaaI family thioesterase [Ruegeria halocynthiae]